MQPLCCQIHYEEVGQQKIGISLTFNGPWEEVMESIEEQACDSKSSDLTSLVDAMKLQLGLEK